MLYLDLVGVFNLDLAEVTGGVNEKPRLLVLFFIIKKSSISKIKSSMTNGKTTDQWYDMTDPEKKILFKQKESFGYFV